MTAPVTPNEIAKQLGVTGLMFRNWLRQQKALGHPLVAGHEYRSRYSFTAAEAEQLAAEFRGGDAALAPAPVRSTQPMRTSRSSGKTSPVPAPPRSAPHDGIGHRVTVDWVGTEVETLEDLLRDGLRAVTVGINPAPVSVAVGHYYQGRYGQRFFHRLTLAGLVPDGDGFEDDRAFAAGIGFTDVVKRATVGAGEVSGAELKHGREILEAKLTKLAVPLVIFVFKKSAQTLLGPLPSGFYGLVPRRRLGAARLFVMPGPTAPRETEADAVQKLRRAAAQR